MNRRPEGPYLTLLIRDLHIHTIGFWPQKLMFVLRIN